MRWPPCGGNDHRAQKDVAMAREALPPTAKLLSSWKVSNEPMVDHRRCRYLPSELPHIERHVHCTRFCGAGAFQHLLELSILGCPRRRPRGRRKAVKVVRTLVY